MALHYLDPTREPRECPAHCHKPQSGDGKGENCSICDGTGRLGEEGAEPDVETFEAHNGWYARDHVGDFLGRLDRGEPQPPRPRHSIGLHGPYFTEAAALAAARKANRAEKEGLATGPHPMATSATRARGSGSGPAFEEREDVQ